MPVALLEDVLAGTVADNRSEIDALGKEASALNLRDVIRTTPSGDALVDEALRITRVLLVRRLDKMTGVVADNVAAEGEALVEQDPSNVGVIDEDAVKRANKARGR